MKKVLDLQSMRSTRAVWSPGCPRSQSVIAIIKIKPVIVIRYRSLKVSGHCVKVFRRTSAPGGPVSIVNIFLR